MQSTIPQDDRIARLEAEHERMRRQLDTILAMFDALGEDVPGPPRDAQLVAEARAFIQAMDKPARPARHLTLVGGAA